MKKIKTLFISDVHLGTKKCQADKLLEVFKNYESGHDKFIRKFTLLNILVLLISSIILKLS